MENIIEAIVQTCSVTKVLIKITQNSQDNLYQALFFDKSADLRPSTFAVLIKNPLAQLLSYEFCKIFKNTVFTEHLWATASVETKTDILILKVMIYMFWRFCEKSC